MARDTGTKRDSSDDGPKAAASSGTEPQTDEQTVAERQAELSPERIVQQGNEPNGESKT